MPAYSRGSEHWLGIYPSATDEQNEADLVTAAKRLSAEAKTRALAILVHDSDVLMLLVFENGVEVDSYNSCPGYFDGGSRKPKGGNLSQLASLSTASTSEARLGQLLHRLKPLREQMVSGPPSELPLVPRIALGAGALLVRAMLFAFTGGKAVFVEQILADLAVELGIPEAQATTGFRYLDSDEAAAGYERVPPKWVRPR